MTTLLTIILALSCITQAVAGEIRFDFNKSGDACSVVNRGDTSAYYPVLYRLDRTGRWAELPSGEAPAELPPGRTFTAAVPQPAAASADDIGQIQAVMIRFFDQSGVSFGRIALLSPPQEAAYSVNASFDSGFFRLSLPPGTPHPKATWLLAPFNEGVAPITSPVAFTHKQPPATRIDWGRENSGELSTGVVAQEVLLLHETDEGVKLQKVVRKGSRKVEHRAAWLSLRRQLYAFAIFCGFCGTILAFRTRGDTTAS